MGHTYVKLHVHLIFATSERKAWFRDNETRYRMHRYLASIGRNNHIPIDVVGGWIDHVHILLSMPSTKSLADCVRTLKSSSSRWFRETFMQFRDFHWQEGYSAFAVSQSLRERVNQYIENQETHHASPAFDLTAELERYAKEYGDGARVSFDDFK